MSKSVKTIVIIAAIVLVLGIAATVTVLVITHDPENVKPGLYFGGERVSDPGPILTIGEHEISYDEYRYYYLTAKDTMAGTDTEYWASDPDQSKAKKLRAQTEQDIREAYAWNDIAKEMGIGLTEEESQEIRDDLKEIKRQAGTEFKNRLRDVHITTEELYIYITEMQTIQSKVQPEFQAQVEEESSDELMDSIVTAKHILFTFETDATGAIVDEDATLEMADQILGQILQEIETRVAEGPEPDEDGNLPTDEEWRLQVTDEVFEEYRLQYDADSASQTSAGYTFGEGTMVQEFYDGARALEVGEISEPVRTSYGYHLILRLPLNESEVEKNRETLLDAALATLTNEKLEERAASYPVTYNEEYYDRILPANVK